MLNVDFKGLGCGIPHEGNIRIYATYETILSLFRYHGAADHPEEGEAEGERAACPHTGPR